MDTEGLSTICAGLGIAEEDEDGNRLGYTKTEYCLDNLKDLLRFLRRDDPQTRDVFKQVCKWNTVSKDLIPIIEHCQDDCSLVLNAVKVLVFLTMPVDSTSNDIPQQVEYLWGLKSAITCSDIVAVIVSLLEAPLENLEKEAFTEDDWKLVQLFLTFIRNILAVQDFSLLQKTGCSAAQFVHLRDKFLEILFHENIMDLIIVLSQHAGGSCGYLHQDKILILEIFCYICVGQEPELIAKAYLDGSKVEGEANVSLDSLKSIMEEEEEKTKHIRLSNLSRHSLFSGTFTKLTVDGSKTLFKGKPTFVCHDTVLKPHKVHRGPIKKARTVWEHGSLPSTKVNILELLHDFINQFLSGGYNVLMQSIFEDIEKEHHTIQNCDVMIFFQVVQFVTSFQYHRFLTRKPTMVSAPEVSVSNVADNTLFEGNICGPIAATMTESMFTLVISKWRYAFDSLKETNDYKFLSTAGSLMKTMIRMLDLVLKLLPEDSKEPQTARILLYKLFYDQTDQGMTQFLLTLIKSFDMHKQPRSDLADWVEMMNVVLQLLENLQTCGQLRVTKMSRKRRKKEKSSEKGAVDKLNEEFTAQNDTGISNFQQPVDLSKPGIQNSTIANCNEIEEDANIPSQVYEPSQDLVGKLPDADPRKSEQNNVDTCYEMGNSSGDEQLAVTDEVDFKVSTLISSFANTHIICNLCWLLNFYKSNLATTNHYIICMLQRICDDLELSPMLYQLSLLTIFYNILAEQKLSPHKEYENIVNFLTNLVRKMLRKMKKQPLLFVEILFWKTRKECHYIQAESLLHELSDIKRQTRHGEDCLGDEQLASEGQGWVHRSIADALGDDEADFVVSHERQREPEQSQTNVSMENEGGRKSNINSDLDTEIHQQGNEMGFSMMPESRKALRKKIFVLNNELEEKIKDLYEMYKDDQNCSHLILEGLGLGEKISHAQVSNKLKRLGLKIPTKRKLCSSDGPGQLLSEGKERESEIASLNSNELDPTLRQPLRTRKRKHAFSEDQEMMIKSLYEQFKDHRRCNSMIANALDPGGTFTATQVSRKLRQLGLYVAKKMSSERTMQLRDDLNIDGEQDSEDEPLLLLDKRNKKKRIRMQKEVLKKSIDVADDNMDDELLSSLVKKRRRSLPKSKEKLSTISVQESKTEPQNEITDNAIERLDETLGEPVQSGNGSGEKSGVQATSDVDHLPSEQLYDDLADSGDEMAGTESQENVARRRKVRMVLDVEDDDE